MADSFEHVERCTADEYIKNVARTLKNVALKKANYLTALQQLKLSKYDTLRKNILNPPTLQGYIPLVIHNERKFDYKTLEVWGMFFLEAIDPCHRRLMPLFDVWKRNHPKLAIPDFFLWLEDQNVSQFFPSILLIDENELPNHELFIQDNIMYKKVGKYYIILKLIASLFL